MKTIPLSIKRMQSLNYSSQQIAEHIVLIAIEHKRKITIENIFDIDREAGEITLALLKSQNREDLIF